MRLLQNALRIKEGDRISYLKSSHRHDYVAYEFKTGEYIAVDGGNCYRRLVGNFEDKRITDWSLTTKDNFQKRANRLLWGGYANKNGTGEFKYSPIKDLSLSHLYGIKDYLEKRKQESGLNYKVVCYWIGKKEALADQILENFDKEIDKYNSLSEFDYNEDVEAGRVIKGINI